MNPARHIAVVLAIAASPALQASPAVEKAMDGYCRERANELARRVCSVPTLRAAQAELAEAMKAHIDFGMARGRHWVTAELTESNERFGEVLHSACPGLDAACLEPRYRARTASIVASTAALQREEMELQAKRERTRLETQRLAAEIAAMNQSARAKPAPQVR